MSRLLADHVIQEKIKSMGLSIVPGQDFEIVDNLSDDVMTPIGEEYHALMARKGITPKAAQTRVRANTTVVSSMLFHRVMLTQCFAVPLDLRKASPVSRRNHRPRRSVSGGWGSNSINTATGDHLPDGYACESRSNR